MVAAKQFSTLVLAVMLGLVLFVFMNFLIRTDAILEKPERDHAYLNFIRVDPAQDDVNTKDRRIPEPPPPPDQPPETPDFSTQFDKVSTDLSMDLPTIGVPVNDGGGPYLGTLQAGQGLAGFDTDVIPVVRVAPAYPRRAKQAGIEGWVTMEVTIRPDGTVSDAKVMESDPPRLFDEAALMAMQRWKFRPKIVDGTPVAQRAKQTIEFTLEL
jgi:protein TonB